MATDKGREARNGSGSLVTKEYKDDEGRWWVVAVPEGETDLAMGIPIGPPDLSGLNLPLNIEVRLHNQLWSRGLITAKDIRGPNGSREVFAALQSALKVDVASVTSQF